MSRTSLLIIATIIILFLTSFYRIFSPNANLPPVIAIANYGPHSSLEETIRGIKDGLYAKGFREGKTIEIKIDDVNFDIDLIPKMFARLKESKPKLIVAISTPVAQAAKNNIKDMPIIFAAVTDPVEAGILKQYDKAEKNITGSTDTQEIALVLKFAKKLSPQIKRVGILYSTTEANDLALLKLMQKAASDAEMELLAVPIESARDVPAGMNKFKGNVDMIYVGSSGPIQPSLPIITSMAELMQIPVFNMNAEEVKSGQVFASYGVSYYKVGVNAGTLIAQILKGKNAEDLITLYPKLEDYDGFISTKRSEKINFQLPKFLPKSTYVVD